MRDASSHTNNQLTTSSVARELNCSETTVRNLAKRGDLPSLRLSSGMRVFQKADVDRVNATRRAAHDTKPR